MNHPNRLVILGGSLTALALARDARAHGITTHVVDDELGPALASRAASAVVLDQHADHATLRTILGLGEGGRTALIATGDAWIRFIVKHREVLDGCFDVVHASNESLRICLDKLAFADWCAARGLDAPRHWAGDRARDVRDVAFPVLLRPASTLHAAGSPKLPKALELDTPAQLAEWLARYDAAGVTPLVTESLLRHGLTQLSIPFARNLDGTCESFVARKIRPPARYCRVGTCVELCPDDAAEALARRAIEALDYRGIGEVEVLCCADTGKYYLIEINARPWLQYALAPASGHDFLGIAMGIPRRPGRTPCKTGFRWIDFGSDLYICFSRSEGMFARGELGLIEYVTSVAGANVFAKFAWNDPAPFLQGAGKLARQAFMSLLSPLRGGA